LRNSQAMSRAILALRRPTSIHTTPGCFRTYNTNPWSLQTPEADHHHQYNWLQKSLFEQKPLRSVLRRFTTWTTYKWRTYEMFAWICTAYTAKVITFIQCPSLYDNCQQDIS
jgi:hypothetical protein